MSPGKITTDIELSPSGADAAAHSQRLCELIAGRIKQNGGQIGFDEYMHMALYEPGLGYYVSGMRKFGPAGDFITAPEMGDLFGRCIARQCQQVLKITGGDILEFGAGSGTLATQILRELS
ncbi:MAG: SAM-dependent methyltransferase, partial [Gammaproteobacteria bacterium]|nr:SAM-dependent methyltransferase [Gammaproteobacteria bacterium]